MKAIHGGKAKNDTIDAQKSAVLLRGGMLPQADVYPADMRATRDLLRRRMPLMRKRAELRAHIHKTNSQYHLPDIGKKLADKANRDGVAERLPAPAVQQSREVDLALIHHDDRLLTDLARSIVQTATEHEAHTFSRVRSIPGVGKSLALVLLDAIHEIRRCPRVQEFVSSGRLVTCAKASLTWAFSDAAGLCLRNNPVGQKSLARLEKRHGQGKALPVLAHQWARAVSDLLTRDTTVALDTLLHD
jgi:hypothetical protein